jgi:uncharacterized protein YukE
MSEKLDQAMPFVQIPVRRPKELVPPEAELIAAQLYDLRERGEALAAELASIQGRLDQNWNGAAKRRFLVDFDVQPGASAADAAFLGEKADRIARLQVTIWQTVLETIYDPG